MIQDLHSHTYYSICGKDDPHVMIEAAIAGGIELFGLSDHNHGIAVRRPNDFRKGQEGDCYRDYFDYLTLLKEEYKDRITILRDIELCTLHDHRALVLPDGADVSYYDYALIECLGEKDSILGNDLFSYAKRVGCYCGLAHTDMFGYIRSIGEDPETYFRRMAEANIFWEMNVNYDSIHGWRELAYVKRFFESEEQQEIIRRSGVKLSIGFDGHRIEDYLPERIRKYCLMLEHLGLPMAFSEYFENAGKRGVSSDIKSDFK